jgi:uncharacterized protein DUF3997
MVAFRLRENVKRFLTNSQEEIDESEKEADSILKHDSFYKSFFLHKLNYWIISNKSQEVLGPYTKSEYENQRKKLSVPQNLQIEYNN